MKLPKILKTNKSTPHDYAFSASKEERKSLVENIISSSSPQPGFYFLLAIATLIVTIGLINNNLVLIIGGMLVAPLLSPILSLSLSILILDFKVLWRSLIVFFLSALACLSVASIMGLTNNFELNNITFLSAMMEMSIFTIIIPIAAGAAASFTWAKKNLSCTLPGVAVTVTLLPPLAATGLALAKNNSYILTNSLWVYVINVLGIIIGSLLIFLIMGFYREEKVIVKQVEMESQENS